MPPTWFFFQDPRPSFQPPPYHRLLPRPTPPMTHFHLHPHHPFLLAPCSAVAVAADAVAADAVAADAVAADAAAGAGAGAAGVAVAAAVAAAAAGAYAAADAYPR